MIGCACLCVTQTVLIIVQFGGLDQNFRAFLGTVEALNALGVQDLVAICSHIYDDNQH